MLNVANKIPNDVGSKWHAILCNTGFNKGVCSTTKILYHIKGELVGVAKNTNREASWEKRCGERDNSGVG